MRPSEEIVRAGLPVPLDRAFTSAEVVARGVRRQTLKALVDAGLVRAVVRGLYAVADLEMTVATRAHGIARVVPPHSVVTDQAAAWIHGVDLLDHREGPPALTFVRVHGQTRLRRNGVDSGTRMFVARDLVLLEGVRVSTPLRTALDLGRRPGPARALGALDGLLRTGRFAKEDLERELTRFKGFRGVVQLRALVPLADDRAESPAESKVRFHWVLAADLPKPTPQLKVESPFSDEPWRLDLGVEELKYGVEYDGAAFHASHEQQARDRRKREYLRDEAGWTIDVLERHHVYGPGANPVAIIRAGLRTARLKLGVPSTPWRWPDGSGIPPAA